MKRHLFENMYEKPPLTVSISAPTPNEMIYRAKNALYNGADAFLFHLENLNPEFWNEKNFGDIFEQCGTKPVMVVCYPSNANTRSLADDELFEIELDAIRAGASCVDIRGDMFDRGAHRELSMKPDVIKKQNKVIEKVHETGAQVIMSCHVLSEYLDTETLIEMGKKIQSRGADIVKIVMNAFSEDQMVEAYTSTYRLHKELEKPVLHLLVGKYSQTHRMLGAALGSCLSFCVDSYDQYQNKVKPQLRAMKAIYDNLHYYRFEQRRKDYVSGIQK